MRDLPKTGQSLVFMLVAILAASGIYYGERAWARGRRRQQ
jgi:hypothetical protein